MPTLLTRFSRSAAGLAAAFAVAAGAMLAAPAALAQICPYNSTQATCACPTSGSGTTCFGGQLFRSSDNSCQNDIRPVPGCASNQVFNCATTSCQCDTGNYPCPGCTAQSSTPGSSCSSQPSICPGNGGVWTNQCSSTAACPAGKTLCATPSPGTCVNDRSCPAGTTWDVCNDVCTTPYVRLMSPLSNWVQSGYIWIDGDIKSTGGDIYLASSKALRVDGTGTTSLNIGNWASDATGIDVNLVSGRLYATGISTIPADATPPPAGTIEMSELCIGVSCRTTWPGTADFNPTYVNTSGSESMSGPLTITNTGAALNVAGRGSFGSATLPLTGSQSLLFGNIDGITSPPPATASLLLLQKESATVFRVDADGVLQNGNVPWGRLSSYPPACGAGLYATAVGGTLTCSSPISGGTVGTHAKFATATSLTNSIISDDGTTATVNGYMSFGSNGNVGNMASWFGRSNTATGTGSFSAGEFNTASGSRSIALGGNSQATGDATIGIGNYALATSTSGYGSVAIGNSVTSSGLASVAIGLGISTVNPLLNNVDRTFMVGFNSNVPTLTVTAGSGALGSLGNVGVGTSAPTARLDVNGTGKMTGFQLTTGPAAGRVLTSDATGIGTWQAPTGVTGSGTANYVPKFTAATTIGNSQIFDNGTNVGIGTASPTYKVHAVSSGNAGRFGSASSWFDMWTGGNSRLGLGDGVAYEAGYISGMQNGSGQNILKLNACSDGGSCSVNMNLVDTGNIGIGTETPSYKVDITGDVRITGAIGAGGLTPSSSYGIRAQGTSLGGQLQNSTYGSVAYPAYYDYGIYASGTGMGGYFYDTDNGSSAYNAYGGYSFYGTGVLNNVGDVRLNSKHAFRGNDSWLRLNQDGAFSSGVYTPGNFRTDGDIYMDAKLAFQGYDSWLRLNQGGAFTSGTHIPGNFNAAGGITTGGRYYSPGWGNLEVDGTITTNYWLGWWSSWAVNGGSSSPSGTTMTTDYAHLCMLVEAKYRGNGGDCKAWVSGGWWYRQAIANSSGDINCVWYCYKYR